MKAAGRLQLKPLETSLPSLFEEPTALKTPREMFLQLRLEFFFKTPQRRDLDNGLKIVQDLVCEALGIDDRNVVSVELIKRVDAQNPRLEVTVLVLSSWEFSPHQIEPIAALDLRPFVPSLSPQRLKSKKRIFSLAEWLAEREEGMAEI